MKGFSKNDTVLVYYSEDFSMQIEINVEDYIKLPYVSRIGKAKFIEESKECLKCGGEVPLVIAYIQNNRMMQ